MIEYNQSDDSNLNFLPVSDRNIHSEHIIPRAYYDKEEWSLFRNDEKIADWINKGANLTLLSGAKNISASNEGFDKKLIAYNGKGNYNNEKDSVTSFQITQKIVNDYHSKIYNGKWNWESITDRWNWFCNEVEKLLEIDLTVIKESR